jgi:HD superfamily phosphohydrolase
VHGFVRADRLEAALIGTRPLQRLRGIRQLGFTNLVFPGAEHSRFSHVLGAMELAGRVVDALERKQPRLFEPQARRLVRAAALLHDIGHAPFSHSAEDLFADGIDHEEMTRRLLALPEIDAAFAQHGDGLASGAVAALLGGRLSGAERVLCQVVSGELDVDKMDYLLRDSLFCGVRYGNFDLDRVVDTLLPLRDEETGAWGLGLEEGGVHAAEGLVLARYYMFTQVYFNLTGKVLELHLAEWMRETGKRWPSDPNAFLAQDDATAWNELRSSPSPHAAALAERAPFPLAFETREHLTAEQKAFFESLLPELRQAFGDHSLLVSNASKDPHRLTRSRVQVRHSDGTLEPLANASQFMRHMTRIERYRVYAARPLRQAVGEFLRSRWPAAPDRGSAA